MKLNADLSQRAVVNSNNVEWIPSPAPGVWRKPLERDGDEVARLTSIVRYDPGCAFPEHEHGGGEEFFVLEGTFEDEFGAYPAGTFVKNPVVPSIPPSPRKLHHSGQVTAHARGRSNTCGHQHQHC